MMKGSKGIWIGALVVVSALLLLLLRNMDYPSRPSKSTPAPSTATPTSVTPTAVPTLTEMAPDDRAKIYYVSSANGSDSNSGLIEDPWKTVQHAVDSAHPGDTIYLREGMYPEQIVIKTSGLPDLPITLTSFPGETATIEGRKNHSSCDYDREKPAIMSSGEIAYWIIQNLNIQNICSIYSVRLGWFEEAVTSYIILKNNHIKGAVFTVGNNQLFEGNTIDGTGYSAPSGSGGINDSYGGFSIPGDSDVDDNTHHNIYRNNYIHDFTNHNGRGIWSQGRTHDIIIEGNTIENILPTGLGQCIDLDGAGYVQWRQVVKDNNVKNCSYVGIQLENVFDSLIENNRVLAEMDGSAGIIVINYNSQIGCGVGGENNQYGDLDGNNSCKGEITNNVIRQNVVSKQGQWDSGYGALVNWGAGGLKILGNTFYAREAHLNGAINFQEPAANTGRAVIQNNILYNGNGSAICAQDFASFDKDEHNMLYRSDSDSVYGSGDNCFATYSLSSYQSTTGKGQGSIQDNPLFVDESQNNLQLKPSSSAIDSGVEIGVFTDINGLTRPQGTGYDIGAYEYSFNTMNTSIPPNITATTTP